MFYFAQNFRETFILPKISVKQKKIHPEMYLLNETSGIRTPDNLIKSQVLYRLS